MKKRRTRVAAGEATAFPPLATVQLPLPLPLAVRLLPDTVQVTPLPTAL